MVDQICFFFLKLQSDIKLPQHPVCVPGANNVNARTAPVHIDLLYAQMLRFKVMHAPNNH